MLLYAFDESANCNISSLTVTADITDHLANIVLFTTNLKRFNYCDRPFIQLFNSKNTNSFQKQFPFTDWSPIYNSDNIDESINYLVNTIKDLSNVNFPLVRCSRRNFKDKPWLNKDLKDSILKKRSIL